MTRLIVWLGAGALVVLLSRSIAYALEPSPLARVLEHRAGGPALPTLALVTLSVGTALAVSVCWLAAMGVRERAFLERRSGPRFRPTRVLVSALVLAAGTSVVGALFEAWLHWRSGLGWHGLQCFAGPIHRDLLPIDGGLSLVAAAVIAAGAHVVAWMRRTFAALGSPLPRIPSVARIVRFELAQAEPVPVRYGVRAPRPPPPAP
jgi:Flp pilus assembly pilin Flp